MEFSLLDLVLNASMGVKVIIFILLLSSIYSWYIIFKKYLEIKKYKTILDNFEVKFWSGKKFEMIYKSLGTGSEGIELVFREGFKTFFNLEKHAASKPLMLEKMIDTIKGKMHVKIQQEEKELVKDLSILATISSTAPYVGLLGTVYGILIAFWSLGSVKTVTINIVGPHIAEALIATAIGLFVAIPSQVAYNRYQVMINEMLEHYKIISNEIINLISTSLISTDKIDKTEKKQE